jgi:polysaccharide chain length determinant protein (PEP-CTERM system associated)
MNDERTFSDLLRVLRNRTRPAIVTALSVLVLMAAIVFLLPAVYEASATLLIEQMSLPVELTGGAGAQDYVEQRLQRTRQRVLTNENVKSMIERHNLYQSGFESEALEDKLAEFNANVLITPQVTGVIDPRSMRAAELTYAFNVGFRNSDAETTQRVANELADLFVKSSAAQAVDEAKRAIEFARTEAERLASELREREARLAKFRQEYPGGLPEDRVRNQERAMQYERDRASLDADLRAARARLELYQAQLRDTPRDSPVLDETGQVVLRGSDRLAAAQQELVAARAKYSEDHPDVRRLRREIAQLSAEASGGSTSAPTNPAYIQLDAQAKAAAVEVRELTARRNEISGQLASAQGAVSLSPRLEEQYTDLVRDYEVIKAQYEQMRSQQATAELQSKAASGTAAETYVLINPALTPDNPVQPDRLALMFLGIVLAAAAGLGTAFLLNMSDSTVRGSVDVVALAKLEPFAHVPTIRSKDEIQRRRITDLALAAGMAGIAVVLLLIVA